MPQLLPVVMLAATFVPIAYYLYVGLRAESRPADLDEFFVYSRRVNAKDFANTSIGYSLQVAALFLFADWGIRYGFGAFWVPLFWGLGFLLLYFFIPWLDRFLAGTWTLHGYLYERTDSRILQVTAAFATIIGLWGTMMVEVDYASTIYRPFFANEVTLYGVGMLFVAFAFFYIAFGGYKAEVNTERIQVPVAYATLLIIILVLLLNLRLQGSSEAFAVLAMVLAILFVLMIVAKLGTASGHLLADRQVWIPLLGLVVTAVFLLLAVSDASARPVPLTSSASLFANLRQQLTAQGFLPLVSLLFANSLWQFVDISSWQRVASVDLPTNGPGRHVPLRRGLWRIALESPVSWGFGVVLGMSLQHAGFLKPGDDPALALGNFVSALAGGQASIAPLSSLTWILLPLFGAAVVAIMLSTISALLSAVTFTAYHDLPHFTQTRTLGKARVYTFAIASAGALVYYVLRHTIGISVQTTLYTFYSSQLALLPTVTAALFARRVSAAGAILSLVIGVPVTFAASFHLPQLDPDFALLPPLVAIVVSSVVYLLALSVRRHD